MRIDPNQVQWDAPAAGPAPAASPAPGARSAAQAAIDPSAVQWDAAPQSTAAAPATPERSLGQELGRQAGLFARHAVNGVAALPAMAADAVGGVANAGLDAVMGQGNGFRFPKQAEALDNALTKAGLPTPETPVERVVGDATSALAGTGGIVKAGQALASGAAPAAQAVGRALSADPALQAVSSVTGGAASGTTREAGGGEGAQLAAGLAGALVPVAARPTRVLAPGGAQVRAAAQQAADNGLVIPPVDLSPGAVTEGLSGFSGKIKTAQVASARNQPKINDMARRALGLPPEAELSVDALETLRKQAAGAYAPVASAGTITPGKAFTDALDKAVEPFTSQARSFPGMRVPEVVGDIAALRSGQFDSGDALNAIRFMREGADKAYRAGENQAGKAYRQAAAALEDAVENHLQGLGQPGANILKNFRDARQLIAKSYSVQSALNPATGNINALKLASDLARNKPLTGDLRSIGEFAQAFPRAAQSLKEAPNATSPLDWIPAALTAVGTGNPVPLAAVGARPAARSLLLSDAMQRRAVRDAGTVSQRIPDGAGGIAASMASQEASISPAPETVYRNRLQAGYAARQTGGEVVPVEGGFVVRSR